MYTIKNEKIRVSFDKEGNLQELVNLETGHNYAGGKPVWRINFQNGKTFECEILAETTPVITAAEQQIVLNYSDCQYEGHTIKFGVKITVSINDDDVEWSADLSNDQIDCNIRDFHFPVIHGLKVPEKHILISSEGGGKIYKNIADHVIKQHSWWKGVDHIFTEYKHLYPRGAATNCFAFTSEDNGFYFGCHISENEETVHSFRMYGDDLCVGMARYPSCAYGESCHLGKFITSMYKGSWHVAATKYRSWVDSSDCPWFEVPEQPEWVKKMNGWQRIIMKHQYGDIHYDYSQLPEIREDGQKAGVDALFMFGWQNGGHDNNYPDYTPDAELGTEEQLKAEIKDFTDNKGQVILYANGQLMDLNSEFYKEHGRDVAIKDLNGNSRRDAYLFRSTGNFYGTVANRAFEHACPYSEIWENKLKEVIDTAAAYGCQSAFFDQLGRACFPCCDPTHGHKVPAFDLGLARGRQIKRLREHCRSHSPEMALGVELLADVTACQTDYIHSLHGFCKALNDWEVSGAKPELEYFIDWFRYMFPEVIMSDREIRDDSDIERRVNHALLKGLRSDIEIYRCRKTIAETPNYQQYLAKIDILRTKYVDLLLEGLYRDTEMFTIDNEEFEARSFVNGDKLAVVVTQSHLKSASVKLTVPGYTYVESDSFNCSGISKAGSDIKIDAAQHGLAVIVFTKE